MVVHISRIRKDPDERRTELIDAALELFSSAGYEKTTVTDIVKKAGVAKGTFFYYFPTKEAVLETIISRWASEICTSFKLKSRYFSALDKLQFFIEQMLQLSQIDTLCDTLLTENQFNLMQKLYQEHVENVFNPLLADMLQQGNQEGAMHVELVNETIAFFWSTIDCLWEAEYFREPSEVFHSKVKVAESIIEHIFGIEAGALKISIAQL